MADIRAMYQQAFDQFADRNYDAAIDRYGEVIEVDPDFTLAYHGLAEAHARRGDLEAAVVAIRRAIVLDPQEPLFHTSLSRFYQQQGKIQEAEDAAAVATRLQSTGSVL